METLENLSPLVLEKKGVVLVKPSNTTPLEILSLSTIDNDPYIETLCKTIYVYRANEKTTQQDPASLLQEALSKALVYYYPLAGKLRRRDTDRKLELTCNADGVPFISATAVCKLSSINFTEGIDAETAQELVPNYDALPDSDTGCYHPFALQVTKFPCGGFTLGLALSHSVCDGSGAAQLFRAIAEFASGKNAPSVKPVWERERLEGKPNDQPPKPIGFDMASVATSPYTPTTDMVREIVNVRSDCLKRLKTRVMEELLLADNHKNELVKKSSSFTTLEILSAYVWRARFRALKLNPDGITLFGVAVGARRFLDPPLPEGYYGNAFVKRQLVLTGRELNESPLSHIIILIKELKKINNEYVLNYLRDMTKLLEMNVRLEEGNGAFMLLTDLRHLQLLEEVDFGWKETMEIVPLPPMDLPDICMLLPPSRTDKAMEGGARVLVTLPRAAMAKFKEEMDALGKLGIRDDTSSA